jgi:hypothetical protein
MTPNFNVFYPCANSIPSQCGIFRVQKGSLLITKSALRFPLELLPDPIWLISVKTFERRTFDLLLTFSSLNPRTHSNTAARCTGFQDVWKTPPVEQGSVSSKRRRHILRTGSPGSSWSHPGDWFDHISERLSAVELKLMKSVCRGWCRAIRRRHKILGPFWFPTPELVSTFPPVLQLRIARYPLESTLSPRLVSYP